MGRGSVLIVIPAVALEWATQLPFVMILAVIVPLAALLFSSSQSSGGRPAFISSPLPPPSGGRRTCSHSPSHRCPRTGREFTLIFLVDTFEREARTSTLIVNIAVTISPWRMPHRSQSFRPRMGGVWGHARVNRLRCRQPAANVSSFTSSPPLEGRRTVAPHRLHRCFRRRGVLSFFIIVVAVLGRATHSGPFSIPPPPADGRLVHAQLPRFLPGGHAWLLVCVIAAHNCAANADWRMK